MKFKAVMVALVMVALTLSGCADSEQEEDDDTDTRVVEADENIHVDATLGAARGVVRNEQGSPVPEARVGLVGTEFFKDTSGAGRFQFVNVTPGDQILRVESQGFEVWEAPIPIEAGKVTDVNVTLLADLDIDPDLRPHLHDMWLGQTEVTIMDEAVPLNQADGSRPTSLTTATGMVTYANFERQGSYDVPIILPAAVPDEDMPEEWPALIYPGTQRVEVTLDWTDEDSTLTELALGYRSLNMSDVEYLDLQGRGEPWTIDVPDGSWTDRGHQDWSLWEFVVNSFNEVSNTGGYRGPGHFMGEVQVRIDVFRTDAVPLEPAHPDFWGDNTSMVLRPADQEHTMNPAVTVLYRDPANLHTFDINLRETIVPPGTTKLRLDFRWEHTNADGTVPGVPWVLTWRSPDQHPQRTPLSEFGRADPIEGSTAEQHLVYEFEITKDEADAFYQKSSVWSFLISREGEEDSNMYVQEHRYRQGNGPAFYLEVTAFKE